MTKNKKVLHLHNKTTGEHTYYGSMVALCKYNEILIPKAFYHTLKRLSFAVAYDSETYIIRLGVLKPSKSKP